MQREGVVQVGVASAGATAERTFGGSAGAAVAIAGALTMLGWATDIEYLKSIVPGMIVMIPNTALCFMLAGTSLWLQRSPHPGHAARLAGTATASAVLLLGALFLLERLYALDFGIDLLLFGEQVRRYPYQPPGLMASNTALGFTLAGAGLLQLGGARVRPIYREVPATSGLAISSLALLGYVFDVAPLYTFDRHTGMALLTALSLVTLHLGLLFARPQEGGVALLTGRDMTGALVRRLLLASLVAPIALSWLWLQARNAQVLSREGGIALLTVAITAVLFAVVLQSGRVLRRTDREREALLLRERDLRASAESARAEAETATRVKTEFLATMSHELRTPLNAIIGYASLLGEGIDGPLTAAQHRHLERVKLSAEHLLGLINQVLSLSRVEAEREPVRSRPIAVEDLVSETVAIAEPLFSGGAVRFETACHVRGIIHTDPDRVRQILLNLLSNAAKFTERGAVTLRVGEAGDRVDFDVTDSGIGIAPEHHARIFEPFWQVEMNTTRRYPGAGLGLSLSRRLAELLGGELIVQSAPGAGSIFRLSLPRENTHES